jgi:hypothetical protein
MAHPPANFNPFWTPIDLGPDSAGLTWTGGTKVGQASSLSFFPSPGTHPIRRHLFRPEPKPDFSPQFTAIQRK